MTDDALKTAIETLTQIQREAVDWENGALLVLAGPGSGKTQVLTCRIGRILDASRDKNFKVLALTFTNKAADEMKERVANFVPGLEERANIGTFHGFCVQMLRQHGVHLEIKPNFSIYSLEADRRALLEDALRRAASEGKTVSMEDVKHLPLIDRMKTRLIGPENAVKALERYPENAHRVALTYQLYEDELRRVNALDFDSLIFNAHRLLSQFPAIAAQYRRTHPYWLIDEFQDTNIAQYRLIKTLAGNEFSNVYSVADDDQIIYQWNGASFKQIQAFIADFKVQTIQLPTNYRCPPAIVEVANRLVVYNTERTASKKPLVAGKTKLKLPEAEHLQTREFETESDEVNGIAYEIAQRGKSVWGEIRILARTRALLEKMHAALQQHKVPAVFSQRRDDFLSPQLRWLSACLTQVVRPLDRRSLMGLVEAYNRIANITVSSDQMIAEAEGTGRSYFATWHDEAIKQASGSPSVKLLNLVSTLLSDPSSARNTIDLILSEFDKTEDLGKESDLAEDLSAWREISRDIAAHVGRSAPLDQFLQELQLRSKEPSPKPGQVTLTTIHGAKGGEFDYVYVIGLAEDVLPSFHSLKKGDKSPEMEEERRNCFVAITRAKESLILSRAKNYRGWQKQPSRFLVEMGLTGQLRKP